MPKSLLILAMFLCSGIQAQQLTFLAARGQVTCIAPNGKREAGTAGKKIPATYSILLQQDAYACILGSDGISFELQKEGRYTPAAMQTLAAAKKKGSGNKFADLVLKELSKTGTSGEMQHTGAVEREVFETIDLTFPPDTYLLHDAFTITWRGSRNSNGFIFTLSNENGKVLVRNESSEGYITGSFSAWQLSADALYRFRIADKENSGIVSDEGTLLFASGAIRAEVQREADSLRSAYGSSPLGLLALAGWFEAGSYQYEALTCYQEALRQAAGSPAFTELYRSFLNRINLSAMAAGVKAEE